jgi:integration host factor subunit alpha
VVREKRSRVGRNPQTGDSIEISARRVLTFRPSQVLRAEVNSSLEGKPIQPDSVRGAGRDEDEDAEA